MTDNLKQHIKETKALTERYEDEAEKLATVKEEVFDLKVDILSSAFGMLMEKIFDSIDDWVKINAEKEDQNKDLGNKIKDSVERAITAMAAQKPPEVKVAVNLAPLQSVLSDLSKQNDSMINLLTKMVTRFSEGDTGRVDELQKLIVAMVGRQNAFLEREFAPKDYTPQLNSISEGVNKNSDRVEKLVAKRDEFKLLTEIIPVYKTNNK